jgi:ABC-2 type transport system permease protein
VAGAGGVLIGGILLWDVLVRGQLGFNMSFLEEMWSRNMANLLISPLTRFELVVSLIAMSLIRLVISLVSVTLLAILFFGYNLWALGFALAAFFANLLLTGWALAIATSGVILRNGLGAEGLVWSLMFLFMPLCAVFYPVAILPEWLQWVAWMLPPTAVFEGMRALVFDHVFRWDLMLWAFGINAVLIAAASAAFVVLLNSARQIGSLMAIGE